MSLLFKDIRFYWRHSTGT